jgi:hypothetical protein
MTAQGYAEGKSWTFDERYAEGRFERLTPLAQDLLALARMCCWSPPRQPISWPSR